VDWNYSLRDGGGVPDDAVGMKVVAGVEPKVDPLLSASHTRCKDIGLQDVGLASGIPQKLKIDLVMAISIRRKLHRYIT